MSITLPVPILAGEVLEPPATPALPVPAQADSDRDLVAMWVARSASPHTRRNYARPVICFLALVNCPLTAVRLGDVPRGRVSLSEQPAGGGPGHLRQHRRGD